MTRSRPFAFPNPVDEVSARLVATGVVVEVLAFLAVRQWWLLVPLVYGFAARVLSGPRFSPLGQLVTRVITPRVGGAHRSVPGPPKRFAQGIGLTFTAGALVAWLAGGHVLAIVLVAALLVAAGLEAFAGLCLGCIVFNRLIRWGLVPESVCAECADISGRVAARARASAASS
ncbi:MAG: DUF4395 domain-containing protein [Ilumatobacteraceae bacterium]